MGRKKQTNAVVDGKNNGGLHSARRLAVVTELITHNDLKDAVMYQFILSGSDRKEYQASVKAIARHIRTKCRAEYVGGYEVGDEKGGEHAHAFFIIETADHRPADLLDVREGGFIARRIKRKAKEAKEAGLDKSLSIRIERPKNVMHGGAMFARLNTPAKLADCIKWCSYHIKKRSKDDVTDREIYFGSEFSSNIAKREAKRQKHRDALNKSSKPTLTKEQDETNATTSPETFPLGSLPGANQEGTSSTSQSLVGAGQSGYGNDEARSEGKASLYDERDNGTRASPYYEGPEMILTASQKYLAGLYESAVDADMDTDQIRRYLLSKGIVRTPGTVAWELEHLFGFVGYAESHPAPTIVSTEAWDKAAGRKDAETRLSRVYLQEPSKLSHKLSSIGLTVNEPVRIIEPLTQMSQPRSQA
jgi:hypothetical protein